MNPKSYFSVRQQGREADIYIFGDIVSEQWDEAETSPTSLKNTIKGLDVDVINVHIDSPGGAVSAGWAIYNELKQHPARIRTYGEGFIASAALYPFMAGDERYAMNPCAFFFHKMSQGVYGNTDELRKAAEELDKLNEIGRSAFTDNTPMTAEDVKALEQAETWLSPEEALNLGIATAVMTSKPDIAVAQSARAAIIQRVLRHLPEEKARDEPVEEIKPKADEPKPATVMERLAAMTRKEG